MASKAKQTFALQPRLRVLCGKDIALGPGKMELLAHVAATGSLNDAARRMGMSYMRAWTLLQTMNGCFREPLVVAARGGQSGGGTQVTETGTRVLDLYQRMQDKTLRAVNPEWREIQSLLQ